MVSVAEVAEALMAKELKKAMKWCVLKND